MVEAILREFWEKNRTDAWKSIQWDANDISLESGLPWLELKFPGPIPYSEMLAEAKGVRHLMVAHRKDDFGNGYGHHGWKSICFHGLSALQTEDCSMYGMTNEEADRRYNWTEISPLCPVTVEFFKNRFCYETYDRVRFLLLEAGGYILPHHDNEKRHLGPVNMALNNPANCEFKMLDFGVIPFQSQTTFQLDVSNVHAVWNRSEEDRYHIIVHGRPDCTTWGPIYRNSFQLMRTLYQYKNKFGYKTILDFVRRAWRTQP